VSSLGIGTEANWAGIKAGQSGIDTITKFDTTQFATRIAGEVKNFDPLAYLEKKDVKKMDIFIQLAIAAFRAVDGAGMSRVDFLIAGKTGEMYVNEVNTIPGFTTISMYPKMWEASGVSYPELIDRLIALALERHAEKQQLRTSIT